MSTPDQHTGPDQPEVEVTEPEPIDLTQVEIGHEITLLLQAEDGTGHWYRVDEFDASGRVILRQSGFAYFLQGVSTGNRAQDIGMSHLLPLAEFSRASSVGPVTLRYRAIPVPKPPTVQ